MRVARAVALPLVWRVCAGCGMLIAVSDPRKEHCGEGCRKRAEKRRKDDVAAKQAR